MQQSADWLLGFHPDVVLSGHCSPQFTYDAFFEEIQKCADDFRKLHEAVMPPGSDEAHFDLDSLAGWIWPYRTHLSNPGKANLRVIARNPLAYPAKLELRLVDARGKRGMPVICHAAARQEVECDMEIAVDRACIRQTIAVELKVDGKTFRQIEEAMTIVGGTQF